MPSSVSEKTRLRAEKKNLRSEQNKSRNPVWAYVLTAVAAIGLTYGIMKHYQGNSNQDMPGINITNPVNSNISIIELKNSRLNINSPYHVGNGCCNKSSYRTVTHNSVKNNTTPVITDKNTIDDCVGCADDKDLWQNKTLLKDLEISAEENKQYKLK